MKCESALRKQCESALRVNLHSFLGQFGKMVECLFYELSGCGFESCCCPFIHVFSICQCNWHHDQDKKSWKQLTNYTKNSNI